MSNYTNCQHDSSVSVRVGADPIASAWECDRCGHLTPYTDADYAFACASYWTPRAPEGQAKSLAWTFKSREAKFAFYAG